MADMDPMSPAEAADLLVHMADRYTGWTERERRALFIGADRARLNHARTATPSAASGDEVRAVRKLRQCAAIVESEARTVGAGTADRLGLIAAKMRTAAEQCAREAEPASGDLARWLDEQATAADERADRMSSGDDYCRKTFAGLMARRDALREVRDRLVAPATPSVVGEGSDDERRFDLGNAPGMDLEDESPSWRDLMRGIAELRAKATPPAPAGQDEAKGETGLHRGSCVRERCAEDCPKRGTRDEHGRLPEDPLVGTPFPGPVEERADPHGAPMPPLWWDGCEIYGRCGDDYEVVYASMNGQWYPQGVAPLATLPEGAAQLVPAVRVPGGHGPVLAELDEAIGKVRISEPGDVAAISALRAARDRLADLIDHAFAAPEAAGS